jgi:hypothetical protein
MTFDDVSGKDYDLTLDLNCEREGTDWKARLELARYSDHGSVRFDGEVTNEAAPDEMFAVSGYATPGRSAACFGHKMGLDDPVRLAMSCGTVRHYIPGAERPRDVGKWDVEKSVRRMCRKALHRIEFKM